MDSKITIRPMLGIGNRLFAIASAKFIAEKIGSKLEIWWFRNPEILNARFDELFQQIDNVVITNFDSRSDASGHNVKFDRMYYFCHE